LKSDNNNGAGHEIIWKNVVELGRPQMTTLRMLNAYWVPEDTNTSSEYIIIIAFLLQQWWHKRVSMMHYNTLPVLFVMPILEENLNE
jgi:uncharacterized membrane protein